MINSPHAAKHRIGLTHLGIQDTWGTSTRAQRRLRVFGCTSMLAIMDDLVKHHVACGLLARAGRVLLVHRSSLKRWYPNVWDFPGGHLEPGESSRQALVRELREELSIEIAPPVGTALLTIQTLDARIDIWRVVEWDGAVTNAAPDEHDTFGWFTPEEASFLDLADAEYPALIELALT